MSELPSSRLFARDSGTTTPPTCNPFTLSSSVCVGDLVSIVVFGLAATGFFFWSIHAIRKMRRFPFTYSAKDEENEEAERQNNTFDPFRLPTPHENAARGQTTLSPKDRIRTRILLTHPEEDFYQDHVYAALAAAENGTPYTQAPMATPSTPRPPPRAAGQTHRTSSHRSSRHGSVSQGGPYGGGYDEYGMHAEHMWNVSPSRARGSPMAMPNGDYRYSRSTRQMNADPTGMTYAY